MSIAYNVLESIGNTPLIELRKVVPPGLARIVATIIVDSGLRYLSTDVYGE